MKQILSFLKQLAANNNREWFAAHKPEYLQVKAKADALAGQFIDAVARHDDRAAALGVADCTYRIYRDTRFSLDKTPYKTHIGIFVNPPFGKKSNYNGYYLHLEPGNSIICGGTIGLTGKELTAIRQEIYDNVDEYLGIIDSPEFKALFPTVGDNLLKTAPKGFPKDWEHIALLRPRQFVCYAPLTDTELCRADLIASLDGYIAQIKRYNDFINYPLDELRSGGEAERIPIIY